MSTIRREKPVPRSTDALNPQSVRMCLFAESFRSATVVVRGDAKFSHVAVGQGSDRRVVRLIKMGTASMGNERAISAGRSVAGTDAA